MKHLIKTLAITAIIATTAFAQQNVIYDCPTDGILHWSVGGGSGLHNAYRIGDRVINMDKVYRCISDFSNHNATEAGEPGRGTHWHLFWEEVCAINKRIIPVNWSFEGFEKFHQHWNINTKYETGDIVWHNGFLWLAWWSDMEWAGVPGNHLGSWVRYPIEYEYDGTSKTATAWIDDEHKNFPIIVNNGTQTNAGTHIVSATLQIPDTNIILQNATTQFTITRAQGHGSVSLAGWRAASQPNDPVPFSETNGTEGVRFTYRSIDASYPETPARPANPGHYIVKATFPQVQNYNGFMAESHFTISNRDAEPLEVVWTEQTEFVYNKMVQSPIPTARNKDGEDVPLMVLNGQSAAGEYSGPRAAMAIIRDEWVRQFYYLTNNTIDYTISKRPLNVVMRDRNGNRRDTITAEENIRVSGVLFDYIESILGFDNFATDTIRKETDDESVLRGRPRFGIQNLNNSRSLRNDGIILDRNINLSIGERFLVTVITDSISADNYTILERNIAITIGERFITLATDPREDITSIANVRRADNRYGIRFTVNPVSDKAEINVVLPNNERAVETKIVVYDMTGNVVHSGASTGSATGGAIVWDLRNSAGRSVANGSYLVVAEVKDRKGKVYQYSAKLGVRR